MAAQRKFISPPTFSAKPGENAQDWMERYELTGRYNHWDVAEMRTNFVHFCLNHPPLDDECPNPFDFVWLAGQGFLESLPWSIDDGVDRLGILCVKPTEGAAVTITFR